MPNDDVKDPVEEAANALGRALIERGMIVAAGYEAYKRLFRPQVEAAERRAFIAGAQHLFASIMNSALDGGTEETDGDMSSEANDFIDIVFDGPPSHESGRFVETEDSGGRGISAGEWIDRGNGLWALRIPRSTTDSQLVAANSETERLRAGLRSAAKEIGMILKANREVVYDLEDLAFADVRDGLIGLAASGPAKEPE